MNYARLRGILYLFASIQLDEDNRLGTEVKIFSVTSLAFSEIPLRLPLYVDTLLLSFG